MCLVASSSGLANHIVYTDSTMVQILAQPRVRPVVRRNAILAGARIVHITTRFQLGAMFHLNRPR